MDRQPRVAVAQYPLQLAQDWQAYRRRLEDWLRDAGAQAADIAVFPEYGGMELLCLVPASQRDDVAQSFAAMQEWLADYIDLHRRLARQYRITLVAGSIPVRESDGRYRNRSHVFFPDGGEDYQDKIMLTPFERRWGVMAAADSQKVFTITGVKFAIAICYDVEFPLLVRQPVEAGAQLIVVPSCTDSLAGYHRVRIACQARALENQCYIAQAATVGAAPWSPVVDENIGAAAVYGPPDLGLPDDGVLAVGELNNSRWISSLLDCRALDRVRRQGQVRNHTDWDQQSVVSCLPRIKPEG